jgi:hypothetical protein
LTTTRVSTRRPYERSAATGRVVERVLRRPRRRSAAYAWTRSCPARCCRRSLRTTCAHLARVWHGFRNAVRKRAWRGRCIGRSRVANPAAGMRDCAPGSSSEQWSVTRALDRLRRCLLAEAEAVGGRRSGRLVAAIRPRAYAHCGTFRLSPHAGGNRPLGTGPRTIASFEPLLWDVRKHGYGLGRVLAASRPLATVRMQIPIGRGRHGFRRS